MFDTIVPLLPYWLAQIDDDRKLLPMLPSQSPSVGNKKHRAESEVIAISSTLLAKQQPVEEAEANEHTSLLGQQGSSSSAAAVPFYSGVDQSTSQQQEEEASTSSNVWQRLLTDFPDQIGNMANHILSRGGEPSDQQVTLPPGVKIPKKVITPIKVEPKVFFANERTYFSWMKFGTMLATFSLALFNSGDSVGKICGVLYTLVALSTLIYGVGLYYRRRELIRARLPGPYDEMIGPTVICFALLGAVGMNAYLKFRTTTPNFIFA
jgi:uncharacterized membrane protein YidH (DUF202 family)